MIQHVAVCAHAKGLVCDTLCLAESSDLEIIVVALMEAILYYERTGVDFGVTFVEGADLFEVGPIEVAEAECPDAFVAEMGT